MELLLVEDDAVIASGLVFALEQEGYGVRHAATMKVAQQALAEAAVDLAIVDMQLPDGDGFAVGEQALAQGVRVIFLTVMDDEARIVRALDQGAADYVTKPFRLRELMARVRRALPHEEAVLVIGRARIDTAAGRVTVDGQDVALTALEYRLCLIFAMHRGQLLTRAQILDQLWDQNGNFVEDNTLTVYVKRLREKLGDAVTIETVRGWAIVWVRKQELEALSSTLRQAINGEPVEFRDNQEGTLSLLKNDLHTLVAQLGAERDAANAARLEFAEYMENISHQLKTPVTSMMLMADLLESAPPERQEEFLTNIRMSLARMDWLVDTLLKLAKLDAGAVHFEQQAVTARELLDAALAPLAILLDVQDQQVTLTDDGILHCDRRWTVEALTNLLKNACEASPAGSTIVVECGDNPLYAWLSVRDAGAGLSRAEMASLFVRFASSASKNGVGIGLPLALAIVRGQHGDIDVDAGGQGEGATFTMKFYQ